MVLLGKTLKGRSTKPGGAEQKKNLKFRNICKTQEEFDMQNQLSKIRKENLKMRFQEEQKIVNYNQKKLMTYWRKIMRMAKTDQLKNELEIISQNNQRELDSKEAFIQMLDKNLDEADDQYQMALRNHLIHSEHLASLQEARLRGLDEEFTRDLQILEQEFVLEKQEMQVNHKNKVKEMEDMIDTVNIEHSKKCQDAKNEFQSLREETRNKNIEDTQNINLSLDAKQTNHLNNLEQLHSRYQSDTAEKTNDHTELHNQNQKFTTDIDQYERKIAIKRSKISLMKLKIFQHKKECSARNLALTKEKDNIQKNYRDLKEKMKKFREEESKRLTELVNNSRNAVLKLKEQAALGEKLLKTAELCRRLETEKEKVLPFYDSSIEQGEIPPEFQEIFDEISGEQYEEYSYLKQFYKRYNKVLLDKLAIQKQKEALQKDNLLLKSLLKQYLDGISLNDDVMKKENPLMVLNNKLNIVRPPVEQVNRNVVEGNVYVNTQALIANANNRMQ